MRLRGAAIAGLLISTAPWGCGSSSPASVSIPAPPPPPKPVVRVTEPAPEAAEGETKTTPGAADPDLDAMVTQRGWLGIELEATDPDEAGVRVVRVVPGSPAATAGLAGGDVLVRLDGDAVEEPSDVVNWVARRPAGTRVAVMAKRRGADRLVAVELGVYPEGDSLVRMAFIDQPAPPFELLKSAKGNLSPTLADHRGKVLVLEFWAPWCVACRALIPHMNQWHAQYAARGLRVVGITSEPVQRAALVATELGMEFAIFADEGGNTARAYHARAIPMVLVIDRRGVVRDLMIGYDSAKLGQLDTLVRGLIAQN